ncbi:MAG TPA: hypothetical protein VGQ89_13245 [Candidatus Limnocylindrales bacterium]|jgi:hypothetical protein|nr:hypothetical protein [Candidatus Limnocylindrales bacterium]
MASDPNALRSRRALLAAAAGGAAAVAATAAAPLAVSAADPNDVVKEIDNPTTAQTSITQATDAIVAFKAKTTTTGAAGLLGSTGDETDIATNTGWTGVYGWAPGVPPEVTDSIGSGVWGDSNDIGVVGTGGVGVIGDGFYGLVAFGAAGGAGVTAWGGSGSGADVALDVHGKAKFSRSGRATIAAGQSTKKITLTGVTWSSLVFAVLRSNRSGRYVRAVVPTTGSFTIYLNTSVTSSTYVVWFVVN